MLLSLNLAGKRVLVVGAGDVATRRVRALVGESARVKVVAPIVSPTIESLAEHGQVTLVRRTLARADLEGAWLVVAATDNPTVNSDLATWCDDAGVWCVDASNAAGSAARVAAQSSHGDVVLGVVSLGDADPRRAVRLREHLGREIDEGRVDLRHVRPRDGRVILVGSGPGASDLVTVRGMRALREADVVVADRLGATGLLAELPEGVEVIDVGKTPGRHPVPQHEINDLLVARAREGKTVVRCKGGDPFVFGRGGEEVNACLAAGIDVEVVPGISSAIAVPGLAGVPVTQRGISASVLITSGHAGPDRTALAAMANGSTVVALMAVTALPEFVDKGIAAGADPLTPVAIIERGTTPTERVTHAPLRDASRIADETAVKPPAVIVIGEVARHGLLASHVAATLRP